jgi:hypothetical protein
MWRFLLVVFLFLLIGWVIRGFFSSGPPQGRNEKEFVRDSLTGVYFAKSDAVTIIKGGEILYFSSVDNRDNWLHQNGRQS